MAGVPTFDGDCPRLPLNACDNDDAPGPGTDVPLAPASGVWLCWLSTFCGREGRAVGVCDPVGEPCTGVASLAVVEARDGDWEKKDSARCGEPGATGLAAEAALGLRLSSAISRHVGSMYKPLDKESDLCGEAAGWVKQKRA